MATLEASHLQALLRPRGVPGYWRKHLNSAGSKKAGALTHGEDGVGVDAHVGDPGGHVPDTE